MEINVLIDDGVEQHLEVSWLQDVAERVLLLQGARPETELSLVITTQQRVKELNRIYRGKNAPTDVLSFSMAPTADVTGAAPFVTPPDGASHLGEVIISYTQAALQAKQRRHSVRREIAILIIHGVLHLLGYDHEAPGPRRLMRASEKEVLGHIQTD